MRDITKFIKNELEIGEGLRVAELHGLEIIKECLVSINESVNEGKELMSDINLLHTLEPKQIRHELKRLLMTFFEKSGWNKTRIGAYNDLQNIWAIQNYPKYILQTEFRNDDRAIKLFRPMIEAASKLYDYTPMKNELDNALFKKHEEGGKVEVLSKIDDPILKQVVTKEIKSMGAVIFHWFVGKEAYTKLGGVYDEAKILKEMKKVGKLYQDFEVDVSQRRDGISFSSAEGTYLKAYAKDLKILNKKWTAKVKAENK